MNQFYTILTNAGLAQDAAAQIGSTVINLPTMAVGDGGGNPVTPDPEQTALVRERFRAPVNRLYRPDPDDLTKYIAEVSVPASAAGFTMREVGLFDADGNLFAVGNLPPTYKPNASEGAYSDALVRMIIILSNASAITLQVDPNVAVASQTWVTNYVTPAVIIPGGLASQVLSKKSNADGDTEWVDPTTAVNVRVDTVEEAQILAAGQTTVDMTTVDTQGLAVYVDGKRLRADEWTPVTTTQITLATPATGGEHLTLVQNDQTGMADILRASLNLSDVPDKAAARTNLGLPGWIATVTIDWSKVGNKPATFPPSTHKHAIDDVTDLSTVLGGKVSNVTKVATGTGLLGGGDLAADRTLSVDFAANLQSVPNKAVRADDGRLSDPRPPTKHVHAIADITGLQAKLDALDAAIANCLPKNNPTFTGTMSGPAYNET